MLCQMVWLWTKKIWLTQPLQFSRYVMSDFFQPHGLQPARLPVLHYLPEFGHIMSIESMVLSNHLILCHPFSFCLQPWVLEIPKKVPQSGQMQNSQKSVDVSYVHNKLGNRVGETIQFIMQKYFLNRRHNPRKKRIQPQKQ